MLGQHRCVRGAVLAAAGSRFGQSDPVGHAISADEFFGALFVPGLIVGLSQWLVLRWWWGLSGDSVFLWLVGSLIGGCAWLSLLDFQDYTYVPSHSFLAGGLYGGGLGAIAGLVQIPALRGHIRPAPLWIAASAVSTGLGWPLGEYVGNAVIGSTYGACAGYAMVAVLSGVALVWLMHAPSSRGSQL
jgi:hypothetical protein